MSDLPPLRGSGIKVAIGASGILHDGPGMIRAREGSILHGIDRNLYAWLKLGVDENRVAVYIYSGDTGTHAPNSRHKIGCAVDLSRIGRPGGTLEPFTVENALGVLLLKWFLAHGFRIGERSGGKPTPGLLLGPVHTKFNPSSIPHDSHLHVSILRPAK